MNSYTAEVVSDVLTIEASSEQDAEAKYNAFWRGLPCTDHPALSVTDCGCVEHSDGHIYHTIKEATY